MPIRFGPIRVGVGLPLEGLLDHFFGERLPNGQDDVFQFGQRVPHGNPLGP